MSYVISYADGASDSPVATYQDALLLIADRWPDAVHDHRIEDTGRTLVWSTAEDSDNDDGSRAVATIRKA